MGVCVFVPVCKDVKACLRCVCRVERLGLFAHGRLHWIACNTWVCLPLHSPLVGDCAPLPEFL